MASLAHAPFLRPRPRERLIAAGGVVVTLLIAAAFARALAGGMAHVAARSPWLLLHLCAIVPAMPLGAWLIARPKGDRAHRIGGRIWAILLLVAALSSFGLVSLTGRLSPIHILSVITLIAIPRAVLNARRGRIMAHRRGMTIVYASSVVAGLFVFVPGRVLGTWLFG